MMLTSNARTGRARARRLGRRLELEQGDVEAAARRLHSPGDPQQFAIARGRLRECQGNPNVKALVYVAAFAPAERETGNQLIAHAPGSLLSPDALDVRLYPTPDGQLAPEVTAKPSALRPIFAADLPASLTKIAAASQRPAALSTLSDPSGPPAWATIPSWALVAGADKAIGAANERYMAKRIHATTVEAKGASHLVMLSQPEKVVKLIADAAAGRR